MRSAEKSGIIQKGHDILVLYFNKTIMNHTVFVGKIHQETGAFRKPHEHNMVHYHRESVRIGGGSIDARSVIIRE